MACVQSKRRENNSLEWCIAPKLEKNWEIGQGLKCPYFVSHINNSRVWRVRRRHPTISTPTVPLLLIVNPPIHIEGFPSEIITSKLVKNGKNMRNNRQKVILNDTIRCAARYRLRLSPFSGIPRSSFESDKKDNFSRQENNCRRKISLILWKQKAKKMRYLKSFIYYSLPPLNPMDLFLRTSTDQVTTAITSLSSNL